MVTLQLLEEADQELSDAAEWYEEKRKGLGDRFTDTIYRKLEIIRNYPERYPKKEDNFREAVVRIFPYVIVYTFHKAEKVITVVSIFHTRRNPRRKYRRR